MQNLGAYDDSQNKERRIFGARDLMERSLDGLVIERPCLDIIQNSEVIESVQIVNGLVSGNITRALKGEHVGTIIYKQ